MNAYPPTHVLLMPPALIWLVVTHVHAKLDTLYNLEAEKLSFVLVGLFIGQ